jgi:hypothetical protein
MSKNVENECRCEQRSCGCATVAIERCRCGADCNCERACRCGSGCGCGTRK